ncbi:MAG: flagellar biosynthetic protein FliO [Gammaproteobacteria bacterium]
MMRFKALAGTVLIGCSSVCIAASAQDAPRQAVRTVSPTDVMQWGTGLALVLMLFFACVWAMRKLHGLSASGAEKLRVVGGLSLGMREKVVLLEVGKKQLVLGVTPGRIETLLVLDEADCLKRDTRSPGAEEGAFAQKFLQAMKGRSDA